MKYLVMECHPGYAVLMDEESRYVRAANLHYEVGQTVTEPVLMNDLKPKHRISMRTVTGIAAAAACLLILSAVGLKKHMRSKKPETESVVIMVEEKRYEVALNRSGEVIEAIQMQPSNADQSSVIDISEDQHMTLSAFLSSMLQDSLDQGDIDNENPVQIYLYTENENSYQEYKAEIEEETAKLSLKAEVQELEGRKGAHEPGEPPKPAEPPVPAAEPPKPGAEPPKPNVEPPAPEPAKDEKPPVPSEQITPPAAPDPAKDEKPQPEPPTPPETPEHPDAPASPAAPDQHDPVRAPLPAPAAELPPADRTAPPPVVPEPAGLIL